MTISEGGLIDFLAKLDTKYFTKYKVFLAPVEEDDTCLFEAYIFILSQRMWSSGGPNLSWEIVLSLYV